MKLVPRRGSAPAEPEAAVPAEDEPDTTDLTGSTRKGRPTPKRRDAGGGARGPAAPPPRNRKEAYAWQKEQTAKAKSSGTPGAPLSREAHREALRRGDASVLPKRDQGPLKQLARDYVDTRPMLSNYLLLAFVPLLVGPFLAGKNAALASGLQLATFAILLIVVVEWWFTGQKLRKVARERDIPITGTPFGIGFYAGSRAYLPRRWRLPQPRKARGDAY